jgi:hypothetical protein
MKHHFADFLNREYFDMVPNVDRWAYHFHDLQNVDREAEILTITKSDTNWKQIFEFKHLRELTLHEPSKDQLAALSDLGQISRLRISHARPKSLEIISNLTNLEELVLEYVSAFDDLSPLAALPKLRSVFFENLRKMNDFTGIGGATQLKYLSIDGTLDWNQPITNLHFLSQLTSLEHLRLSKIRLLDTQCQLSPLGEHPALKRVEFNLNSFALEEFAWLEAMRPDIEGAVQAPFVQYGGERSELYSLDFRNKMSEAELRETYPDIEIDADGRRYEWRPFEAILLGKGERVASGKRENVLARCDAHKKRYLALIDRVSPRR